MLEREILNKIPNKIGVYIFKDKKNNVLYVGKAVDLKERIKQHLASKNPKIQELIKETENIEIIELNSEAEALLKESDLIKKFDPPFNQLLRDDTQYFYVGFTKEIFPKVFITHQPQKYKAEFLGPFTEGSALRKILNIIRKEIPFCTCLKPHKSTCLNSNLGLCYGWCCKLGEKGDEKIYKKNIQKIKEILKGDLKKIKKKLLNELKKLVEKDEIEKAFKIQKQIIAINKILNQSNLIKPIDSEIEKINKIKILKDLQNLLDLEKFPSLIEVYDISHYSGAYKVGIRILLRNGEYDKSGLRKFKIKTVLKPDDPRMIYEVLKRRLKHLEWELPDIILVDGGKIQLKFALKALYENKLEKKIKIIALAKPKGLLYYNINKPPISLEVLPYNLRSFIILADKLAHRAAIKYHRKLRETGLWK